MAGLYALIGAYVAHTLLGFRPSVLHYDYIQLANITALGLVILVLAIGTAMFLSKMRAKKKGEVIWNSTSKRMLINMSVPLITGGLIMLLSIFKGILGILIPVSLIFYGQSLYNAGHFTFREIRFLGLIQIILGLISFAFIEHSLLLWAVGFGLMNLVYGIFIHSKYER